MHELMDGLARKRVAGEFLAQQIIAIKPKAACSGGLPGRTRKRQQSQLAAWIELRSCGSRCVHHERRRNDIWITSQVTIGKRVVKTEIAVVGAEPIAPIVADAAVLG